MMLAWLALSEKTMSSLRITEPSRPILAAYPEVKNRAASVPTKLENSSSNSSQARALPESNRDPPEPMRVPAASPSITASRSRESSLSPR